MESDFQLLTEIVFSQMSLTLKLLSDANNQELLDLLKRNEKIIDSLDITIKEKVINAIIFFTPRAVDLRMLMAYHDMTISMERVGDLIQNIAESIRKIDFSLEGFDVYKKTIDKMLSKTNNMLKNAIFAFSGNNHEIAYYTILMDDKVDKMDKKMEKKLADRFEGKMHNAQGLTNIMNLHTISYYIERIGDKAVDIAESAIYLIEGKDIRHDKAAKKEAAQTFKLEEEEGEGKK